MAKKEIFELGEKPTLGEVPKKMHAFLVRQDRFGKPIDLSLIHISEPTRPERIGDGGVGV